MDKIQKRKIYYQNYYKKNKKILFLRHKKWVKENKKKVLKYRKKYNSSEYGKTMNSLQEIKRTLKKRHISIDTLIKELKNSYQARMGLLILFKKKNEK